MLTDLLTKVLCNAPGGTWLFQRLSLTIARGNSASVLTYFSGPGKACGVRPIEALGVKNMSFSLLFLLSSFVFAFSSVWDLHYIIIHISLMKYEKGNRPRILRRR